ncbi:peroxide stress protein YaaA [uncultured Massilia sp.]|uniref:peroxide stress protein YaaA n=1 Tax=uncultured Massilia sp. TaxID=169973 RepID=UPI0025E712E4|nr:peroxide stress protein YaaA [uncultured Massilia sp.]
MLIVLSPAKSLDLDTPPTTARHTTPRFIDRAAELIRILKPYSPAQVGALMDISDQLAVLNVTRYADWHPDHAQARQAVMSFDGDVYTGLDARTLDAAALDYAQARVRILSGLYGLLRPLDGMHPYRLEMGTKLANPRGKDLYAFWGDSVTAALNEDIAAAGATALVNLASEEYFKAVKPKLLAVPVIAPVFEDWKNGRYKIISFFAKRARGMMARYAALNGITDPQQLKDFDVDGYAFDEAASTEKNWVFRRRVEA